jgi:hypothetical protein
LRTLRRTYRQIKRSRALRWIYPDVGPPTKFTRDFSEDFRPAGEEVAAEILGEAIDLFSIP